MEHDFAHWKDGKKFKNSTKKIQDKKKWKDDQKKGIFLVTNKVTRSLGFSKLYSKSERRV